MSDVTRILSQIESGDPSAAEQLLPLVYDELRKLAAARLAQEKPGQTLQATALVHEAYLRLVGPSARNQESGANKTSDQANLTSDPCPSTPSFDSRGHFFAAATDAMRRILINRARDRGRLKRGGDWHSVNLDQIEVALDTPDEDLLALDEALVQLAANDPAAAKLVQLRFFAGMTLGQAASSLGISRRTADRQWAYARAWLYNRLAYGK